MFIKFRGASHSKPIPNANDSIEGGIEVNSTNTSPNTQPLLGSAHVDIPASRVSTATTSVPHSQFLMLKC